MKALRSLADRLRGKRERSSSKVEAATAQQSYYPPCLAPPSCPAFLAKILHPDILPAIFTHLGDADLARCLRVSHLFFDHAGKTLYSRVVYGRNSLSGRASSDILTGACGRSDPASPSELALLSHVRSLEFHAHAMGDCSHAPHVNLLPSLDTVTIAYRLSSDMMCFTSCNFIRYLRPKHVKLVDTRPDQAVGWRISLKDTFGLSVEKVSLYARDFYPDHRALTVVWPASMTELDIHLQRAKPHPSQRQPQARLQLVSERRLTVQAIGELLGSAITHDAKLRVMGLRDTIGPS